MSASKPNKINMKSQHVGDVAQHGTAARTAKELLGLLTNKCAQLPRVTRQTRRGQFCLAKVSKQKS